MVMNWAACPDAEATAAIPPSNAAMRFSNTSTVGLVYLEYVFPGWFRAKSLAPCAEFSKANDAVAYIGTAHALVVGSGA
jgi:hypothetical protein